LNWAEGGTGQSPVTTQGLLALLSSLLSATLISFPMVSADYVE